MTKMNLFDNFNNNHDFIKLFEMKLSKFTGAPYVVLTDSASNAIFLLLKFLKFFNKVNLTDNTIEIPKNTYISVPQSIIHAGFKVKFNNNKWLYQYELKPLNIIDAAVNFDKNIYKSGYYMILSFQQKKALNIGKGGAILLDNEEEYEILKRMTWDGRDASVPVQYDDRILPPEISYHMNFTPDMAVKGLLLLNQITDKRIQEHKKSYKDYPDISIYF